MKKIISCLLLVILISCNPSTGGRDDGVTTTGSSKASESGGGIDVGNSMIGNVQLSDSNLVMTVPKAWTVSYSDQRTPSNDDPQKERKQYIHLSDNSFAEIKRVFKKGESESEVLNYVKENFKNHSVGKYNGVNVYFDDVKEQYLFYLKSEGAIKVEAKNFDSNQIIEFFYRVESVRADVIKDFEKLKKQVGEIRNKLLHVEEFYYEKVPEDVKITRLLPRGHYKDFLGISGGAAYFAFKTEEHAYGYGNDIELQAGELSVGFAGCDFGYLVDLGESHKWLNGLENTDSFSVFDSLLINERRYESNGARFHNDQGHEGLVVNDKKTAFSSVELKKGHSYILRSVVFDNWDILVQLQVLDVAEEDKSAVVAYKILKEYPVKECIE